MRLEYSSFNHLPYHFISFSRFGKEENISKSEWMKTISIVIDDVFLPLIKRSYKLGIKRGCGFSTTTSDILYSIHSTDFGVGLLKLPPISNVPSEKLRRESLNKINTYAFILMSQISDKLEPDIYSKLCSDSVIYPKDDFGLWS